jgi:hypothetical protein
MPSEFTGIRFPPEVILLAVRLYLRYGLSYRDLEELLAERGIEVDPVTLYRWVQRFTPMLIDAARPFGTWPGIGGSSTRPTSRSLRSGPTSTGQSTSMARSSTCTTSHVGTSPPRAPRLGRRLIVEPVLSMARGTRTPPCAAASRAGWSASRPVSRLCQGDETLPAWTARLRARGRVRPGCSMHVREQVERSAVGGVHCAASPARIRRTTS